MFRDYIVDSLLKYLVLEATLMKVDKFGKKPKAFPIKFSNFLQG